MGIRPHLEAIIGVNDLTVIKGQLVDPRAYRFTEMSPDNINDFMHEEIKHYTVSEFRDFECMNFNDYKQEQKLRYYDVVHLPDTEWKLPNVVGVVPPNHYNGNRLRGIRDGILYFFPWTFSELPDGRAACLEVSTTQLTAYFKSVMKKRNRESSYFAPQQYNNHGLGWFDRDFHLARRILYDFGFDLVLEELKIMLYWYWL